MIEYSRLGHPPASAELDELIELAARVFERNDPDAIRWRIANMPCVAIFVARRDGRMVGFKAGYAATRDRYYSWLGGVDPEFRGQNIAGRLMEEQHRWVKSEGFGIVETHVNASNDAMVALNRKYGLEVTGNFQKRDQPNYIMQRRLN